MDSAFLTDSTLNKNGRSLVGYPSGTFPTKAALSWSQDESNVFVPLMHAGAEGCVPILLRGV